jgi:hypothetical protein
VRGGTEYARFFQKQILPGKDRLEQFSEILRKRKRGQGAQSKAEKAGGLTPVKDDDAASRFLDR